MPNAFTRKKVDCQQSVGSAISSARRQSGKSIEECSRRLSIPQRYLKAIEQEDLESLPGLIYEKNFIKRYAEFLRVRPQPLMQRWVQLRQGTEAKTPEFVSRVQWWHLVQGPLFWRRVTVVAVILTLAGYVGNQLVEMASPPLLVIESPAVGQVVSNPDVAVSGVVAKSATLEVNGQMVSSDDSGVFNIAVLLEPGANTIRAVAEKRYGKPAVVERQVFLAPRTPQRTSSNDTENSYGNNL